MNTETVSAEPLATQVWVEDRVIYVSDDITVPGIVAGRFDLPPEPDLIVKG